MTTCPSLLAVILILTGLLATESAPKFLVTTRKADDTVQIQAEAGKVIFSLKSPSGIGGATIERTETKWPDAVVLKLRLKGLENFAVSNGKTKLHAAVSQQEGKLRVRLWKDEKENDLLDKQSPYWMEIRPIGADGKPSDKIPLPNGHFEMLLPKAIFETNPKSISLEWIDFYRG